MDMNIKGMTGVNIGPPVKPVDKVGRGIKSDSTHERDANGQQAFDQQKQKREPMSDEQLKQALEQMRRLPGVKEHKWTVDLVIEDGKKFVIVKDNLMNVIRKIPELELWTLPMDEAIPTGHLLKKIA